MMKETKDGIVINIKISPNAKRNEIIVSETETKIKITAQPIDGKANKSLIEYLSKEFKIPKTYIEIIKGETSKEKTILFRTTDEEKLIKLKNIFSK